MELAIIGAAILFFLGHGLQAMFEKTKVPDLLILIIIGYLVGPVFGLVKPEHFGQFGGFVSQIALIVILYEAGLHLSIKELKEAWGKSLLLSLLTFTTVSAAVIAFGATMVEFPFTILLAFALGSTSSAIVIPMVKFLSLDQKTKTILSLESAFTDVLAIVLFLVMFEGLKAGKMDAMSVIINIGPKTLIAMGFGVACAFAWATLKRYAREYTHKKFAGEAWALLVAGVATELGLNGAMSVLCLGFMLANLNLLPEWMTRFFSKEPVTYQEMSLLKEITFLLKTFFFLYLGTLIAFGKVTVVLVAGLITLGIFITRYLSIWLLFSPKKYSLMDVLTLTSMGPRGLACAVLATLPVSAGMTDGEAIQQIIFAVIPLTILMTAIFVFMCESDSIRAKAQILFPRHKERQGSLVENVTTNDDHGEEPRD